MNFKASAPRAAKENCEQGYALAALLVAMAVMAVLLTVALPTWNHMMRREKEEELIFRGNQYARAIGAYQRKYASASPPTIDILIEQHFLRKKYKDPMAVTQDGEFAPLYVANQGTGTPGGAAPGGAAPGGAMGSTTASGNIIGVASKNTGESLRTYKDKNHYNEWQFLPVAQSTRAGGAGAQAPGGGGAGGMFGRGTQGNSTQGGAGARGGGQRGSQGAGPGSQQGAGGTQGRGGR
jgi:type II secretory pathway pseudopilin PulG